MSLAQRKESVLDLQDFLPKRENENITDAKEW